VAVLTVSAVCLAWAWRDLLSGAHSPFARDIRHYHHAVTRVWAEAIAEGRLALWADHAFFGFPLFADPQVAAFYPGSLLVAAWGPHTGYVIFLVVHAWIAAAGMIGFMRSLDVSWPAAFASGMLVSLCGYFAHEAQHPGLFAILCWLPCWLWATHRLLERPGPWPFLAVALVVASMLFAGTLQVLFGGLVLYAFFLGGSIAQRHGSQPGSRALYSLCLATGANALGLALAAVVVVPAIAHLPLTARALGMTYELAAMGSVHSQDWIGLFISSPTPASGLESDFDYAGVSFYIGALTLPLAAFGLLSAPRRLASCLVPGMVLLVALAMGRPGVLHPWLYDVFPDAVGGLRGMGRALGPLAILLAVFASFGIQRSVHLDRARRRQLVALLGGWFAVTGLAIAWADRPVPFETWGSLGIVGLGVVAVLGSGNTSVRDDGRSRMRGLDVLLVVLVVMDLLVFGALRGVLTAYPPAPDGDPFPDAVPQLADVGSTGGDRLMLHGFGPVNLPLLNGVDGVGGYNPLVTLQYLDFVQLINHGKLFPRAPLDRFVSGAKPQRFTSPLFDAASVTHVLSNRHDRTQGLQRGAMYDEGWLAHQGAARYENSRALPRAYLAFRTLRSKQQLDLVRLLGSRFDGRRTTVVEGDGPELNGPASIRAVVREGSRPEHRSFEFSTERPAVLVVTDSWYPGWQAWVDDKPASVFRVNGMFRGVSVPANAHRVEMRFVPRSFRVGAVISTLAGVGILLLVGLALRADVSSRYLKTRSQHGVAR